MNTAFTANGENGLTQNSKILPGDTLTVVREEETLEVRITKVESWEEEIAYTTETTKSNELNSGTKRVTQKGENGVRTVTAQRVYDTNGNQLSQQILSAVVTKEPVETMVMLEMSWRSVSPTARLSMLKPLLAKRPDIWERTPSLFSTSTEKIPFILRSPYFVLLWLSTSQTMMQALPQARKRSSSAPRVSLLSQWK